MARYPNKASPQTAIVLRSKELVFGAFAPNAPADRPEDDRAERSEPPVSTGGLLAVDLFHSLSLAGTAGAGD